MSVGNIGKDMKRSARVCAKFN